MCNRCTILQHKVTCQILSDCAARTGLEEARNSCSTVTAGVSSRAVTCRMLQMARAASKMTISLLWRRHPSKKS